MKIGTWKILGLGFSVFLGLLISFPTGAGSFQNLILNGNLETPTTDETRPQGWQTGFWGDTKATFGYVVDTSRNNSRIINVTISERTSGDAKWFFDPIPATPNTKYTYSTDYSSAVRTDIVAVYFLKEGGITYEWIKGAVPTGEGLWTTVEADFITPTNVEKISVYHVLGEVGKVSYDNVSLVDKGTQSLRPEEPITPNPTPNPNPIVDPTPTPDPVVPPVTTPVVDPTPTPVVTPTPVDNGQPNFSVESVDPSNSSRPLRWNSNNWGVNQANFEYLNQGRSGNRSLKTTITSYTNGDAKWYPNPISVQGGKTYSIGDYYKSSADSLIVLQVTSNTNTVSYLPLKVVGAASDWTKYQDTITLPANAVSISIMHLIYAVGFLQTDDYFLNEIDPVSMSLNRGLVSITFDDSWASIYKNALPRMQKFGYKSTQYVLTSHLTYGGYMNVAQLKDMQAKGHEIQNHTVNHYDLTTLSQSALEYELTGANQFIKQNFGVTPIHLASPYGAYNDTVLTTVKKYFASHRTVEEGFNTKQNFDPHQIKVKNVNLDTSLASIQQALKEAADKKYWLVLVYHEIAPDTASSGYYRVRPAMFEKQLQAIKDSGIQVSTFGSAFNEVSSQIGK
jgi:peptidoglycan/xylan/chitin deacetylase (PgdA/CDA1 family)